MGECMVSIIMPVYNAEKFLAESIGDILEQTYRDYELICVDDGSCDNSFQILEEYSRQEQRISVISQKNRGAGAARNTGMRAAKGKYLLFLDADDRFERNMLEKLVHKSEEIQADVLVFDGDAFDYLTQERKNTPWLLDIKCLCEKSVREAVLSEKDKIENIFRFTNTTVWNKLWKHVFILENKISFQEIYVVDSMYFVMKGLLKADRIGFLNQKLVHYRSDNPSGQLRNHDKNATGVYDALLAVKREMEEEGIYEKYEEQFLDFAAENCLKRLKMLRTNEGTKRLYCLLHEGGLENLGLTKGNLEKTKTYGFVKKCESIVQYSYEEYLYNRIKELKDSGLVHPYTYRLPRLPLAQSSRIILYGCGNVGKSYYVQLMHQGKYKVVGWADKSGGTANFPIQKIEEINHTQYDLVLIAVLKETIADSIKKDLAEKGFPFEKLF